MEGLTGSTEVEGLTGWTEVEGLTGWTGTPVEDPPDLKNNKPLGHHNFFGLLCKTPWPAQYRWCL